MKLRPTTLASGQKAYYLHDDKDRQLLQQMLHEESRGSYIANNIIAGQYPVIAISAGMSVRGVNNTACYFTIIQPGELAALKFLSRHED